MHKQTESSQTMPELNELEERLIQHMRFFPFVFNAMTATKQTREYVDVVKSLSKLGLINVATFGSVIVEYHHCSLTESGTALAKSIMSQRVRGIVRNIKEQMSSGEWTPPATTYLNPGLIVNTTQE